MKRRQIYMRYLAIGILSFVGISVRADAANQQISDLLMQGKTLYEADRFSEAEAVFRQAVEETPDEATVHYWLGMAYFSQDRLDEAEQTFRRVIKMDRNQAMGYTGLGLTYLKQPKRRMDARTALTKAVKLEPDNADRHYYLGLTYARLTEGSKSMSVESDGRTHFRKAIALASGHPDAYYQLGLSYEFPSREVDKAAEYHWRQVEINPGHTDALIHLAIQVMETNRYQEAIDRLTQVRDVRPDADPVIHTVLAQLTALYAHQQRAYEAAEKAYEDYLNRLPDTEFKWYRDLTYVGSEDFAIMYEEATEAEQEDLWRAFWALRDPNPATVVNERLLEHYRRVLYARTQFARGKQPWDRRGNIYVRYGPPDDRQHFVSRPHEDARDNYIPTDNPMVSTIRELNYQLGYRLAASHGEVNTMIGEDADKRQNFGGGSLMGEITLQPGTAGEEGSTAGVDTESIFTKFRREISPGYIAESWVYTAYNIELFFLDQLSMGTFDYPLLGVENDTAEAVRQMKFHPRPIAEALIERLPEDYRYDLGDNELEFIYDMVTYRGPNEATEVELIYSVPVWQLGHMQDDLGQQTGFDSRLILRDTSLQPVGQIERSAGPFRRPVKPAPRRAFTMDLHMVGLSFYAPEGDYETVLEIRDQATQKNGRHRLAASFDDYKGNDLMVSDLRLATAVTPDDGKKKFVRNGLSITPNPSHLYRRSKPVYVYYEVYNLFQDEAGETAYQITYEVTPNGPILRRGEDDQGSEDARSVIMTSEREGIRMDDVNYTALDTSDLDAGIYTLVVTVTDTQSGQQASKTITFGVASSK